MNAGMFGLPNGQAQSVRKLAGQVRNGFAQDTGFSSVIGAAGLPNANLNVVMTANTRTRLLAINGRGAVRFGAINSLAPGASNITIEVFFDGVRAILNSSAAIPSSSYTAYAGGGRGVAQTAILDFLPFDSSCEVWLTTDTAATYQHAYLIDIHQ